jgi:hypothetical protein
MEISKLKLGLKTRDCLLLFGRPADIDDLESEKKIHEDFGYNTEKYLPFQIGFDEVWRYASFPGDYPVFKLFFKHDALVYIILSSYHSKKESPEKVSLLLRNFSLSNDIRFYMSPHRVQVILGKADKEEREAIKAQGVAYLIYYYNKLGLKFTFDEMEGTTLRTIDIFAPTA